MGLVTKLLQSGASRANKQQTMAKLSSEGLNLLCLQEKYIGFSLHFLEKRGQESSQM